jgi:hypothetical protein
MNSLWPIIFTLLSRYLHIVCTTLLVGGTLFYEMVVPIAIDDLREEQQLYVFARARWVFKWIVWVSALILLVSGIFTTHTHWQEYTNESDVRIALPNNAPTTFPDTRPGFDSRFVPEEHIVPPAGRPGWWWAAHASTGVIALIVALSLTIGPVPPSKPIRWMRLNLVVLLLVMFLATATRHARLEAEVRHPGHPIPENGGG